MAPLTMASVACRHPIPSRAIEGCRKQNLTALALAALAMLTITVAPAMAQGAGAPQVTPTPAVTPANSLQPNAPKQAAPAPLLSPQPLTDSQAERDYRSYADEILAPILAHPVSDGDLAGVKAAFAAIGANDIAKADAAASGMQNTAARKLIAWYKLTHGFGTPREFRKFLDQNPSWPQRGLLTQRMEEALFTQGGAAEDIRSYFVKSPPETAIGEAALASALLALGDKEGARKLAAKAWRDGDIPELLETGFLERFKPLLTLADHRWRLDRYLMGDRRWKDSRDARAKYIRRIIPLLPAAEQTKAEARLAVYLRSAAADKLMGALTIDEKADWGLAFQRAQLLRRQGKPAEAAKILLASPTDPNLIVSPDDWWDERRANIYDALDKGNAKLAYELAKDAGPLTVNPLKEQRFMAGWIAMRYLKDPARAATHFTAMREVADGPLSRSKADFWIARALDAQGRREDARGYYSRATKERDTFHGLLAMHMLNPGRQSLEITPPARASSDEVAALRKLDSLHAAVIAKRAGLGPSVFRSFLANARTAGNSEAWSGLVAHLADAMGDTQMALRIAKSALGDGHNLIQYSYPTSAFPAYAPLRDPPETAFLLGIARQETEFNTQIVSGAGARGLLQVMPITARHVCRDHNVKCDIARLLSDKVYNTMIGSAYIGDRMAEFGGNYVLTLAGYNAGPGRAREWISKFGDPREPKVDPVDWIERIPFEETREYVAKVLSNIQIYRARLSAQPALRIGADLGLAR